LGRIVANRTAYSDNGTFKEEISVRDFQTGVYFIHIIGQTNGKSYKVTRLVKL
jgi:hypothetical protein